MNSILWDKSWNPPKWAQNKERLARTDEATKLLINIFNKEPELVNKISHLTPKAEMSENTLFFEGIWNETHQTIFIKSGCTEIELYWAQQYQNSPDSIKVVPQIFASGEHLGEENIKWFVMEKIPYKFTKTRDGVKWELVAKTVAEYQRIASKLKNPKAFPIDYKAVKQFLLWGVEKDYPPYAKDVFKKFESDCNWLEKSCPSSAQFGDLHLGNIFSRAEIPKFGEIVLIDPIPREGPWLFDPAYCQSIASNHDIRLIEQVAQFRKDLGLPVGKNSDIEKASTLMLGWLSIMWWGLSPQRREDTKWVEQNHMYIKKAAVV